MPQEMCPICTLAFKKKDVLVEYRRFRAPSGPEFAHLDCLLHLSRMEDREHPPTNRPQAGSRATAKRRTVSHTIHDPPTGTRAESSMVRGL